MISKLFGGNMLKKFVEMDKFTPKVCRTLAPAYAWLSLVGSILLLENRRELVEENLVNDLITDENLRIMVCLFGHFWLISNGFLLFGILLKRKICIKIHLYFMDGVFATIAAALLIFCFLVLGFGVREMDRAETSWAEMIGKLMSATLYWLVLLTIAGALLYSCIALIHLILTRGFDSSESNKHLNSSEKSKDDAERENLDLSKEVDCNV